jgi:hypothetical protein
MASCREMWFSVNESVQLYLEPRTNEDTLRSYTHVRSKTMLIRELLSGFKLDMPRYPKNVFEKSTHTLNVT